MAYPWMIRHGYAGCATCHADPSGGGLLTAYGRSQSEILLRTHYRESDDGSGRAGEFLFGALPTPDPLLVGGDLRLMEMRITPQHGAAQNRFVFMQADLAAQVTVGRFRVNGSLGYADKGALPAAITRGKDHNLVSRTHWIGVDLDEDKKYLLRAGRLNLPFGLRVVEHTLWVRSVTRTDLNQSQQHGAAISYTGEGWRGELMVIAGNFQVSPDRYRDRGYAGFAEIAAGERAGVGMSSTIVHANADVLMMTPAWRHAHGLLARWAPWAPLVLMSEWDMLLLSQPPTASAGAHNALGYAGMLQADLEVVQGLHVMATGESYAAEPKKTAPSYGVWGSVAWFFAPHADLRGDAIWQTLAAGGGQRVGVAVFLAQLHVFL